MTDLGSYLNRLKPNIIVQEPIFPEPVQVITTVPMGDSVKLVGTGTRSNQVYQPVLSVEQLATLELSPETEPFDGDADRFRLGVEAMRLGLAWARLCLIECTRVCCCLRPGGARR